MKKILILGLILTQGFAVFAQKKVQNDTIVFAYLVDKAGRPILDSADCFIIGDLHAVKLDIFPLNCSMLAMMDDFSPVDNSKAEIKSFKYIIPTGTAGGQIYLTIQNDLEAKLKLRLKNPNLRVHLMWVPQLFYGDADFKMKFVEK